MKTILGSAALLAFLGLFPFAFADSKLAAPNPSQASAPSSTPPSAEKPEKAPRRKATAAPREAAEKTEAAKPSLTTAQAGKLLSLLNEGSLEELDAIPGIARTRAGSIIDARPFSDVREIVLVDGIGDATYGKILAYGRNMAAWRAGAPAAKARKS